MKEPKMIAQKIIINSRNKEGTALMSWEESASHIIEGYGENKKQNALQSIHKKIKAKLDGHNKSVIPVEDQFRLGQHNAYNEMIDIIESEMENNET
jgi:hypothetical protein